MKENSMYSVKFSEICMSSFVMPEYRFPKPCSVDRLILFILYYLGVPDVGDSQKLCGGSVVTDAFRYGHVT